MSGSQISSQEIKTIIEEFDVAKLYGQITLEEEDVHSIYAGYTTQFIAEDKLKECQKIKFKICREEVSSVLDTGSELSLMSQELYSKLRDKGMNLELPVQNINLVSAFSDKSRKVKKQAMQTFNFGEVSVEQIFLIAPGLMTEVLLGVDFCVANEVRISFPDGCFTMNIGNQVIRHTFHQETDKSENSAAKIMTDHPNNCDILTSVILRSTAGTEIPLDRNVITFPDQEVGSEISSGRDSLAVNSDQVRDVISSYRCVPPRQDAWNVMNNFLVEYEKPRNEVHKMREADLLKGQSQV
jgi:hypothetical protein